MKIYINFLLLLLLLLRWLDVDDDGYFVILSFSLSLLLNFGIPPVI